MTQNYLLEMNALNQRENVALDLLSPEEQRETLDMLSPLSTDASTSLMSLSSDHLQTPLSERLPDFNIDNKPQLITEVEESSLIKFSSKEEGLNAVNGNTMETILEKEAENPNGNENSETTATIKIPTVIEQQPLSEKGTAKLNGNLVKEKNLVSSAVEMDRNSKGNLNPVDLNTIQGSAMKKSKSDCFPLGNKTTQHFNLFDSNEAPVLIDKVRMRSMLFFIPILA